MDDQVANQVVHHAANGLVELSPRRRIWISGDNLAVKAGEKADIEEIFHGNEPGTYAIIHVVIVVRDGIGKICELGLESGLGAVQESFTDIAQLPRVVD